MAGPGDQAQHSPCHCWRPGRLLHLISESNRDSARPYATVTRRRAAARARRSWAQPGSLAASRPRELRHRDHIPRDRLQWDLLATSTAGCAGGERSDGATCTLAHDALLQRHIRLYVLNHVLWIQYLDSLARRACILFLLLRRPSSEETMSTRPTHDLGCN